MPRADDPVYVYGVSPKSDYDAASWSGIEGVEVDTVEHDGLVAFTSRLHGGTLTARDVRAHWRVLEGVFKQSTVLPVRFGTVMENEVAVRERLLEPNAERLSALLAEMHGLVQLNVKGRYDEELLLRAVVANSPAIEDLRRRARSPGQQIQLGRMVEDEIARWRAADNAAALRELEPLAAGAREEQVSHPSAFDLAFLVEHAREAEFGAGVGRVRQALGDRVAIRYLGPLPPFSFAEADLSMGSQAWA